MRNNRLGKAGSACALAAAVLTVLVVIRWQPLIAYDERVAGALHPYAVSHSAVTGPMRVLSDWVWDPWTMRALAAAACGWLWWRGDRVRAVGVAVATLVASAVQQGLKAAVGRERPQWPDPVDSAQYAAYPSGHAMTATVVCGLLLWLMPRKVARPVLYGAWTVAAVSVLGVGFTRLYLGVHWFSDVLAGWLLGVALVALVALAACRCACPGRSPASPRTDDTAR
ncbi:MULTISPECIES: phosphatase PAP2 family protein [unclassified Streptomyces]|uniref:phosphatase PAP2 family protein n=1 Tax=unclassified Streptomyces TaxID=2593676 RepID=UPI0024819C16|nr:MULTISPECIES: phosphatase PAP2 family protein [unclassified Streptomyces]MDA5282854.1 phosphatase PAP2 family protein [Streptomyces sp. Isolate_45]MDX2391506.1 phosphatase PAP2 family protein [Streptomyces sp. DK15]